MTQGNAGRGMEGSVVAARVVVVSDGGGGEGVGATARDRDFIHVVERLYIALQRRRFVPRRM